MAPPASLIFLPTEVLAQIISLVDQNSLVALKSVSRALTGLDDRRLWEHLHLTLPRYSGARPFILPPPREVCDEREEVVDETDRRAWLEMEADMCERRYEDALRDKVKQILKTADVRTFALVKSVTMTPRIGSFPLMMLVLDFIHANLQSLNIIAAPLHPSTVWDGDVRMPNYEFRVYDIDFPSSFPHLTHLHMSSLTSLDGDLVTTLCNLAPNLLSLDLHFGMMAQMLTYEGGARYPLTCHTKLRRLRFAWDKRVGGGDDLSSELFASLLYNSPDLQQVIVSFGDSTEERLLVRLLDVLEDHPEVQDLRWPVVESLTGCAKLRRLVVESHAFGTKLVVVPNIPSVEVFYIEAPPTTNRPHVVDFPENPDQYPSPLTFAYWAGILRLFPILGIIRPLPYTFHTDKVDLFEKLDDLERTSPTSSGVVSSIRYGEDEVVSMRFPRTYEQFEDRLKTAEARSYAWPEYSTVIYRSFPVDPSLPPLIRERIFRLQEPQFCKLSDYRGKLVPAEVMQRIQEVAGDRVLDWDKRGVEVESDVWAVLQSWYRAL